jgi:hypothetical protein
VASIEYEVDPLTGATEPVATLELTGEGGGGGGGGGATTPASAPQRRGSTGGGGGSSGDTPTLAPTTPPPAKIKVRLPHPAAGSADFLVPRQRFEASLGAMWRVGDECRAFWPDDDAAADDDSAEAGEGAAAAGDGGGGGGGAAGGSWWRCRIVSDACAGREAPVAADPWCAEGLWERYGVEWIDATASASAAAAPVAADGGGQGTSPHQQPQQHQVSAQSPWELFALGGEGEGGAPSPPSFRAELPSLDPGLAASALAAVREAAEDPGFELFAETPPPAARYPRAVGGGRVAVAAYNAVVALPLGLDVVARRLRFRGGGSCCYYRGAAALRADFGLIASNAAEFNGAASDVAVAARALAAGLGERLGLGMPAPAPPSHPPPPPLPQPGGDAGSGPGLGSAPAALEQQRGQQRGPRIRIRLPRP